MTTKQNATEHLNALIQVSRTVNAHLELDAVLADVMAVTAEVMEVEASSLVLVDQDSGDLLFHITQGEKAEPMKRIRMKPGEGIVGWVVQHGKSTVVNDVEKDPRFFRNADKKSGFKTRAILCVPLATTNRLWGAIEVMNKVTGEQFGHGDVVLCEAIADLAAIAVENAMLHREIVKTERLAAIGQTVAGISHCIKNMLTGVRGGLSLMELAGQSRDWDLSDRGFDILRRNLDRLSSLVLDMLDYSKERTPMKMLTGLGEMFEEMRGSIDGEAKQKEIEIEIELAEDARKVQIDAQQIYRCMLNLVHNAMDATPTGGKVRIQTERSTSRAVLRRLNAPKAEAVIIIRIGDTGTGIDAENRTVIFEPFFSTKGSRGTGLGLACTRKVILEHGGAIELETSAPDPAVFAIYLPE